MAPVSYTHLDVYKRQAIITPPDVFSQIMVGLPLMLLYEIGILISKRVVKKREREFDEM